MQGERGTTNYFTQEMLDMAVRLWSRSSISLMDVRRQVIRMDQPLLNYRLPASTLMYTSGERAAIQLNEHLFNTGKFGIVHGGKGTELSIHPSGTNLEMYMVLYKSETAPFYKREIRRLLEHINPFTQVYGFAPENPVFFMEKCRSMFDYWSRPSEQNLFHAKIMLYQLVHEIYRELGRGNIRYFETDYVELVKQHLDRHYTEPVSLQLLADGLPISRSLLGKLFRKREHKSLQVYLNEKRLESARHYLQNPGLTLQEVALGCGFADELNLNRMFKKYMHMTPGDYRRKMIVKHTKNDIDNDSQRLYNGVGLDELAKTTGDGELVMFGQARSKEILLPAALCLMLLLTACASTAPANNASSTAKPQVQAQASPSAEAKETVAVAQTRVVTTEHGEVEVPADPQRIVYLVGNNVGDILPFGKTVVGVDQYGDPSVRPEAWKQEWGALVSAVSIVAGNDPESILALEPDLIIGSATWSSLPMDQLSKIAPTIFYNEMSPLDERMTFFGEVFGMQDKAQELITQYAAKVEAAKQRLIDGGIYDKKIVFLQGVEDGTPGLQGDKTRGIIYEDLGMHAPEIIEQEFFNRENKNSEGYYSPFSMEVMGKYLSEADIISYTNFGSSVENLESQLASVAIWKTIPAVQKGNIQYHTATDTLIDYDYASRMVSLDTFVDALLELPIAQK